MSHRLVRRSEVAKQPGYNWAKERWLIRLNSERRLAFTKISGTVLIDLDDLDRMAEQGRVEPVTLRSVPSTSKRAS